MFDFKTNVSCVLESIFAGFKDENIKMAADKITELHTDELESLKTEIEAEKDKLKMKNFNVITGMEVGIDIIDNHISELEGENNE